ncbi:cellulase family glycosylhydrolase [Azospirillum rugosum]|uniref:cellulase n=1 Tax=Azospirillum rugosum TaxID=416170 RepID=A0ABS4SWG0_9PROT|nr:carbohydrate-binding domain-containing protein [Azospirillum rugosum]MBP2296408.1 endoglucanase [Azospirillum rugosum]MDQ0529929.1 endoglucanase [Azospirillum rugosum]
MATTTTSLVDTTFVVNASGQAAGGIWPQLKLRLDGVDIGQATVSSTSTGRYTFKAQVAPDQAHKVQIVYDNDGFVNGQDRNLIVKSIEVNGKTVNSTNSLVTYDKGALDGIDVVPGQEGLWWNGALNFALTKDYFPVPTPSAPAGNAQIVLNLQGNAAGGQNAHFNLLVDGKKVGEGTAGATAKDFAFATNVTQDQAHKIQIQYDNDATVNGVDRNLIVNKVTINGHAVNPTDANVTYDKGALDGQDVVKGQSGLWWNGTLQVAADKSWFPGSTTTPTTPPAPTPTKPSIAVSDVSVTEPTGTKTSAGIAPGFLHTEGGQIVDSAGHNVKLTGVNWFGAEGYAFAPQGLWMDSYQNHMDKMQDLGFNVIRLPYSDAMLDNGRMPTGIDYSKNPDLAGKTSLQVFDKIIEYADKIGMKIILDHHRSGDGASANENGLWYTDQYPESKMIANWKMLAQRYAGNDAVIGADLHNEPHNPTTWGDGGPNDWARAAERIGNAIQTVNKDWLLIVEGNEVYNNQWYWWGGNLLGQKAYDVKFNTPGKLVYSVHDYGPSLHMMDWFKDANFPNNMPAKWTEMWGRLIQNDQHPVLVGEFGSRMETAIDQKWMPKLVQYMNGDWNGDGKVDLAAGDQGASWTYWAWSPGSGDTGGIMNDSWQVDYNKYNAIKAGLFSGSSSTPNTADAVFTVKLSQAYSQTVTVDYATADGTAKAGSDYTATSGKLTFAAGETSKTVTVKVLSDSVTEGSETFNLKLSNATQATIADATGVGTINAPASAQALSADVDVLNHTVTQQATATVQSVDVTSASAAQAQAALDLAHLATLTDHMDHTVSPYAHFMTDGA